MYIFIYIYIYVYIYVYIYRYIYIFTSNVRTWVDVSNASASVFMRGRETEGVRAGGWGFGKRGTKSSGFHSRKIPSTEVDIKHFSGTYFRYYM